MDSVEKARQLFCDLEFSAGRGCEVARRNFEIASRLSGLREN